MKKSKTKKSDNEVNLKFLIPVLKKFRHHFIALSVISIVWSIFTIVRSYSLKLIIDGLQFDHGKISWAIALYVISWIATEGVWRFRDYVIMYLKPYLKKNLITFFAERIMGYNVSYFQKNPPATLVNGLKNLYDCVEDGIYIVEELLTHFILIVSALISMYIINVSFSVITVFWFVIWGVLALRWSRIGHSLSYFITETRMKFSVNVGDLFSNISTIKTFNAIQHELEIVDEQAENVAKSEFQREKLFLKIWIIQGIAFFGVAFLVIYILLDGYKKKIITIGDFAMLLDLIQTVYLYLFDLAKDLSELSEVSGKLYQNINLLYKEESEVSCKNLPKLTAKIGNITLEKVQYKYPDSFEDMAFSSNITLNIPAGTTVALVGPSGGGKSTLVKLLLGLIQPTEGKILIDGQNISEYDGESVREVFALVPQEFGLFHRSIKENICYGSFDTTQEQMRAVAKKANIDDVIEGLPNGYNTIFAEEVGFSGGQKQRIVIARGLLRKAKIFLFDESTSALDAQTEFNILKNIEEITKNCTKIIIAHRLNTIRKSDLILVCDKGEIIEQGTHEELLNLKGLYYSLMQV